MTRFRRVALAIALLICLGGAALFAQDQPNEFLPVQPGDLDQEQIPAATLVFVAYAFVWATLLVYVISLWRRMARVEADLKHVSARLGERRG